MGFVAKTFIFNNIPSEFFGLELGYTGDSDEGGGEATYDTSSNSSLLTQKYIGIPALIFRSGANSSTSVPLIMYSTNDGMDAQTYSEISSWLFGQQNYATLRMCQNDMIDVLQTQF